MVACIEFTTGSYGKIAFSSTTLTTAGVRIAQPTTVAEIVVEKGRLASLHPLKPFVGSIVILLVPHLAENPVVGSLGIYESTVGTGSFPEKRWFYRGIRAILLLDQLVDMLDPF